MRSASTSALRKLHRVLCVQQITDDNCIYQRKLRGGGAGRGVGGLTIGPNPLGCYFFCFCFAVCQFEFNSPLADRLTPLYLSLSGPPFQLAGMEEEEGRERRESACWCCFYGGCSERDLTKSLGTLFTTSTTTTTRRKRTKQRRRRRRRSRRRRKEQLPSLLTRSWKSPRTGEELVKET